jgi:hypothetical protein
VFPEVVRYKGVLIGEETKLSVARRSSLDSFTYADGNPRYRILGDEGLKIIFPHGISGTIAVRSPIASPPPKVHYWDTPFMQCPAYIRYNLLN